MDILCKKKKERKKERKKEKERKKGRKKERKKKGKDLDPYLTPYTNINLKWIADLNLSPNFKIFSRNIGENLYDKDFRLGKNFLDTTPKA